MSRCVIGCSWGWPRDSISPVSSRAKDGGRANPLLDIAAAFPFLLRVAGAGVAGGCCSLDSTLARFVRLRDVVDSEVGGSGLEARGAFRFREVVGGAAGGEVVGAGGPEPEWLEEEPAESLAAERVTLGDMRNYFV
jgi:hypothetical protein